MCDYLDYLFETNRTPHEGEKSVAALEFFRVELKGTLIRCRRAMRGWKKVIPSQSRLPLPRIAMMGICMDLLARNFRNMALMTLTAFDCYLRPGEALDLRGSNVVAPVRAAGRQYRWVTLVIREFEGRRPDKTGVFDNSIPIDKADLQWLGQELLHRKKVLNKTSDLMFNFNMEEFRKQFQRSATLLGLDGLHPYQLRHGGATEDLSSQKREYSAVKSRGRWKTNSSIRRYGKIGKVQQLLNKISASQIAYCKWADKNLEKYFKGVVVPRSVWWLALIFLLFPLGLTNLPWKYLLALHEYHKLFQLMNLKCSLSIHVFFHLTMFCALALSKKFWLGLEQVIYGWFGWECRVQLFLEPEKTTVWVLGLWDHPISSGVCLVCHLKIKTRFPRAMLFSFSHFAFYKLVCSTMFHLCWRILWAAWRGNSHLLLILLKRLIAFYMIWIIVNSVRVGKNQHVWYTNIWIFQVCLSVVADPTIGVHFPICLTCVCQAWGATMYSWRCWRSHIRGSFAVTLHMWPGHFVVRGGCANWWYLSARCIYLFVLDFLHQAFRDPIFGGISQLAAFICLHLIFCIRHFEIPFHSVVSLSSLHFFVCIWQIFCIRHFEIPFQSRRLFHFAYQLVPTWHIWPWRKRHWEIASHDFYLKWIDVISDKPSLWPSFLSSSFSSRHPPHLQRGGCANWWYLSARCIYLFALDFLHQAFRDPIFGGIS